MTICSLTAKLYAFFHEGNSRNEHNVGKPSGRVCGTKTVRCVALDLWMKQINTNCCEHTRTHSTALSSPQSIQTSSSPENVSHQGGAINNQASELHQLWCHAVGVPLHPVRRRPWKRAKRSEAHMHSSRLVECTSGSLDRETVFYSDRGEVKTCVTLIWMTRSYCACLYSHLFLLLCLFASLFFAVLHFKLCSHVIFIWFFFSQITQH